MWMLAYMLIMLVVSIAIYASMPKPKSIGAQMLSDSGVPTAQDGRELCVVFGEVWIDDNNVLNWGAPYTTPIKAKGGK